MKRLTEKHYGANDYYMTCSEECERDNCVECAAFEKIVDRLGTYEDTGLTPEEINDLASVREISPEAEYAINKHADSIIERLDKLLAQTDDDDRLRELAEADREGRVVVLPYDAKDAVYGGYISDVKGTYLEVAKELLAEQVAQCVKLAMLDKDMFVVDGDTVRWKLWIFPEEALRRAENGGIYQAGSGNRLYP